MKNAKRIQILFLVIIMLISSTTTAFASEVSSQEPQVVETYDFEITQDSSSEDKVSILATSSVNNTFNVYNTHTGSSRTYSGKYLRYSITITDTNGNPVDNILAVRLYDSNHTLKCEDQFWADGSLNIIQNIPINAGTSYYFKYILAYGTLRTLRVHMEITSYS